MSSPNIKLQSLIRKYKNGIKETIDKKKIIENHTYTLNINENIIETKHLLSSKNKHLYKYNLLCNDTNNVNNVNNVNDTNDIFKFDLDNPEFEKSELKGFEKKNDEYDKRVKLYDIESYLNPNNGFLVNLYNVELCDEKWLIFMYFMNRLYANFTNCEKIKIKSLHINMMPGSSISALHHFLYNSNICSLGSNGIHNIEWDWIGTTYSKNNTIVNDDFNIGYKLTSLYGSNLLHMLEKNIYNINNINYIINETLNRKGKVNLICVDNDVSEYSLTHDDYKSFISYAILAIKTLESISIAYIRLPDINIWDTQFINILLLYSLIFQELYIFKFMLNNVPQYYLICKNKKKINNEILYKKLLFILQNTEDSDWDEYNLFIKNVFEDNMIKSWLDDILSIIKTEQKLKKNNMYGSVAILFNDIITELDDVLNINIDTFL